MLLFGGTTNGATTESSSSLSILQILEDALETTRTTPISEAAAEEVQGSDGQGDTAERRPMTITRHNTTHNSTTDSSPTTPKRRRDEDEDSPSTTQ